MTPTSASRTPYFRRVSLPGMSPHFEPTASPADGDSFFHPRPRLRPVPAPAPRPPGDTAAAGTSAATAAPPPAASATPAAAAAGHPVWDGLLDAAAHLPGAHRSGRRGAWILAALLALAAGVAVMAWREIAALW